jgi:hypothetical protein
MTTHVEGKATGEPVGKVNDKDYPPLVSPHPVQSPSSRAVPAGQREGKPSASPGRRSAGAGFLDRLGLRNGGINVGHVLFAGMGALAVVGSPLMFGLIGHAVRSAGGVSKMAAKSLLTPAGAMEVAKRNWDQIKGLATGALSPWGAVAVADGLLGLTFVNLWIATRETNALKAGAWALANWTLGSLATGLYIGNALWQSKGDWRRFWMGQRCEQEWRPRQPEGRKKSQ